MIPLTSTLDLIAIAVVAFSTAAYAAEPTSVIPAKREFLLSTTVSPCEDFHKYVCAKAEADFKLREDRSHHTFAFSDSSERLLESKKDFMKNLPKEKKLTPRAQQAKDFYLGCMNTKVRVSEERSEIRNLKKELNKITNAKDFVKYLNNQTYKGKYNFIGFYNNPNKDNPLKLDVFFGAILMDLPDHSYYEKPDVMAAYKELLIKFFLTAEPELGKETAAAKANQQIQLQLDFAKVYPKPAIRRERYSERHTDSQKTFLKKYNNLQLNAFLKKAPKSTQVNAPVYESLQFLNDNLNDKNLQVYKDFYLYKAGSDFMDEAYPDYFNTQFEFEKKFFGGPQARSDLQERCTRATSSYFMMEIDQVLIDRVFPGFKDAKIHDVADRIRASIASGIEKNSWLSPEAKFEAKKKIKTARLQLVRPKNDREWDFTPVQKYSTKMYIGNKAILKKAQLQKTITDLKYKANQDAWGMGPLIVNAYYSPTENKFVLPIGILQFPFFDKDGDIIENLGAVGAVVGHELGHSIDDQGSKYDSSGKLNQWMGKADLEEFGRRGQRMIDQFDKVGHNGKLTQGENIADLVGLTFAYNAAFPGGVGSEDDKKRFFVSYGRVWCTVSRPDYLTMLLKTDPHAAGYARINEQVKHQPAFAEAFKCKATDKMVISDEDRLQIW